MTRPTLLEMVVSYTGAHVEAQYRLVSEGLGVKHLRLILGPSMGGMHTWLWAERYPDMMDGAVAITSQPVEISGRDLLWRPLIIEAIRFAFRVLSREKGCAVPGVGNNPVLALALSALLPGLGQGYNRQWIKAGAFMAAGTASAWPLLSSARPPDSFASLALRLLLPTMLLAAFEIWSMVDAYHVARARLTR